MGFNVGIYIITNIKKKESYLAKSYNDVMIKPCVGEALLMNNTLYKIKTVAIDYDGNDVHAFVEKA